MRMLYLFHISISVSISATIIHISLRLCTGLGFMRIYPAFSLVSPCPCPDLPWVGDVHFPAPRLLDAYPSAAASPHH
ncbi:hypothetical protein FB451DRAFT_1230567 [Mycena latifolia]|nr:hypothetical protein FB451DRAFT_1230567 [Mycena latifolia]